MRRRVVRVLMGAALAAAIVWGCARRTEPINVLAAGSTATARETVRVGLWTLWRDREAALTPGSGAALKSCAQCARLTFTKLAEVRADGNALALTMAGRTSHADRLWLSGRVTPGGARRNGNAREIR